ncbi:unnamed protein product [Urochloa decumbens]|uniref:KIB1-4 beta-propeller domain-containing protein n=1 Tax=Urochloa decumbens TaxID=240449 RepID=A0ABC9B2I7_9POAL
MGARSSKSSQPIPVSSAPSSSSLPRSNGKASSVSLSSSWTDLQPDLAELLLLRLTTHADRVHFAAVCRHWRFVVNEYSLIPPLPWVSYRGGSFECLTFKDGDVCSERHFISFREEAVCHGSFGNWQLFQERAVSSGCWHSRQCYLRNPLSGAMVRLPSHCDKPVNLNDDGSHGKPSIWQRSTKFDISKVMVCSDDLIAAIVLYRQDHVAIREVVICCRPGMSSWSRGLFNRDHYYVDMAFYKEKLYALTHKGHLFVHEVATSGGSAKAKPRVHQIQQVILSAPSSFGGVFTSSFSDMSSYLVISHTGKLWMVRWVLPYGKNKKVVVKVFEADLEASQWLEVTRLDDQALFLSGNCSTAISTSGHDNDYPKGNMIYFLDYRLIRSCLPNTNYHACVYNMRSKKFDPISVGQNRSYGWDAAWFFP